MRFWRHQHLRKTTDFLEIRSSGRKWECGFFYVNFLLCPERPEPLKRLGVVASKRIGNAVARNRAKRLLREVFRLNQDLLPESCDIILIARVYIRHANLTDLENKFRLAIQKLTPNPPKT